MGSQAHRGVPVGHQHAVQVAGAPVVQARGQLPTPSLPGEARAGPEAGLAGPGGSRHRPLGPLGPCTGRVACVHSLTQSRGHRWEAHCATPRPVGAPGCPIRVAKPRPRRPQTSRGLDVAPTSAPPSTRRQQGQVCGPEPLRKTQVPPPCCPGTDLVQGQLREGAGRPQVLANNCFGDLLPLWGTCFRTCSPLARPSCPRWPAQVLVLHPPRTSLCWLPPPPQSLQPRPRDSWGGRGLFRWPRCIND